MKWNTLYHIGCILHCVSIGNNMIWSAIWCLVSMSKFFKDNEIARTRWASANFSLWNIYKCLFAPNYTRNHFVTYQRFIWKKRRRESRNFDGAPALFVTYTRVTKKMYSISAIQSRVPFFLYILLTMLLLVSHSDYWFWTGKKYC